jgi:O-antigen ligase
MSKNLISNTRNLVLVLLGFTFPLSVALSNILVVLLAVLILVEGSFSEKIQKINSSKWMLSILILWAMYIISWSIFGRSTDTFWMIKRISLLLLLPIFYTSNFSEKTIYKSVFAFLISMFLSSVIAISKNYEIINLNCDSFKLAAFLEYTDHNVFLAFSVIISLYSLFRVKLQKKYKNILLFFIPFYLFSLFTEGGRAGQLVFLFSILYFICFQFQNKIKILLISIAGVFVFSAIVYNTSDIVKKRYNYERVIKKMLDGESDRSILLEKTIILLKKNPIFGYGTGSFTDKFGSVNETTKKIVENDINNTPHNNYFYVWFELGILGLIVFLSIFYFQIKELIKKADGAFIILFPIMFLIIMFADNYFYAPHSLVLYLFVSIITINHQYKPS